MLLEVALANVAGPAALRVDHVGLIVVGVRVSTIAAGRDKHVQPVPTPTSAKWPGAAPPPSYSWCHEYLDPCFKRWDDKKARDAKMARDRRLGLGAKAEL